VLGQSKFELRLKENKDKKMDVQTSSHNADKPLPAIFENKTQKRIIFCNFGNKEEFYSSRNTKYKNFQPTVVQPVFITEQLNEQDCQPRSTSQNFGGLTKGCKKENHLRQRSLPSLPASKSEPEVSFPTHNRSKIHKKLKKFIVGNIYG